MSADLARAGTSALSRLNLRRVSLVALISAAILAAPMLMGSYETRVACSILLYVMLGSGLTIVVGYAGLLDLGFVAFYAIGAYTYALLASMQLDLHFPFLAVIVIAGLLAGGAGLLLGFPVLRLRGDYLAIVTLGFGEIIRVFLNNVDLVTNGPQGITMIDRPSLPGFSLSTPVHFYYLFLFFATLTLMFVHRLEQSLLGKAWRAIREDQDAAAGIGINTTRAKLAAFGLSATIGGVAGALFASFQRFVSPESFSLQESVVILLIIIVGGLGNLIGVIMGAAFMIVVPEMLRDYDEMRMLIVGFLLVAIILLRPHGLVPRKYGFAWLMEWLRR